MRIISPTDADHWPMDGCISPDSTLYLPFDKSAEDRMLRCAVLALSLALVDSASARAQPPRLEPITITMMNGTGVVAEKGTFEVPENRSTPGSRRIKISYVRFPSTATTPGDPIVYLAGGPGGSGIEAAGHSPLLAALRQVSDVIALDQRGTGISNEIPFCASLQRATSTVVFTREAILAAYKAELAHCFAWWKAQGVDIDGYTTLQSAHDIEELRQALGARRLNLVGSSYGSHLGFAVMKYHPATVNRVVLSGVEGLDQTVKQPALTDALFGRVQALIDANPKLKAIYPDVAGTMRRVIARLNAQPAHVAFTPPGASAPVSMTFDGFAIQLFTAGSIADPSGIARVPLLYRALDNGYDQAFAPTLYQTFSPVFFGARSGFGGMTQAMDLASGISAARLKLVQEEAKTALLGDALNFPMPQILGIHPSIDLGDDFRAPFHSRVKGLFISGTLDGRTGIEAAGILVRDFPNVTQLVVENGGHNILYAADKRIDDAILAFFRDEPVPQAIQLDPPTFVVP